MQQGANPKQAIAEKLAEIAQVNTLFIQAIDCIKTPVLSGAAMELMDDGELTTLSIFDPIPAGTDPYDSRQKILQWCVSQNSSSRKHRLLERVGKELIKRTATPQELQDPRVLQIFSKSRFL